MRKSELLNCMQNDWIELVGLLGWVTIREHRALRTCVCSSECILICDRPSIYSRHSADTEVK